MNKVYFLKWKFVRILVLVLLSLKDTNISIYDINTGHHLVEIIYWEKN